MNKYGELRLTILITYFAIEGNRFSYINDLLRHCHYLTLPQSQWNRPSIQLCRPTKSSCEEKKLQKHYQKFSSLLI